MPLETQSGAKARTSRQFRRAFHTMLWTLSIPVMVGLGALFLQYTVASSSPERLTHATQITHDGLAKTSLLSDGSNLYVTELTAGRHVISRIVPSTGQRSSIATPFADARALDISPDHSRLLTFPLEGGVREQQLWTIPVASGSPEHLGAISGDDAAWSQDGNQLVFVRNSDLYVATATGTKAAKIARLPGRPFSPRFSPDGRRIRFTVGDVETNTSSLWEVGYDGSNLHEVLPGWQKPQRECCGVWTADGRFYIFQASQSAPTSLTSLWALEEGGVRMNGKEARPVRLTDGPMSFGNPWPSCETNKLWALGVQPTAEAVKFDVTENQFSTLLSGISATDLDFSADGHWVAYITIPDGRLWRSRTDGSDRLPLTIAPDRAALPRWSPDSRQIAYVSIRSGSSSQIMLTSVNGGSATPAFAENRGQIDANWSADSGKLLFGYVHAAQTLNIQLLDLKTHAVSTIPGSSGLFSPRWSPDGRYIAALSPDFTRVMLFDFHTQRWSTWLTEDAGAVSYPVWSADSKYLYFDDLVTEEESIRRVKIGETHAERVFVVSGIDRYPGDFGLWTGRAPDGSWMFVRDRSTQEVYSLNIELSK